MLEPSVGFPTSPVLVVTASAQKEWITVLVSLQRPSPEEIKCLDRAKRMALLRENAEFHRRALILWVMRQGLGTEVKRIGASTHFSILTLVCTPHAAKELEQAPGVTSVIAAPEVAMGVDVVDKHN